MGVDAATGKVWLSMRQVLPDPLQETLDALLAQGPPADPSQGGGPSVGGPADDRVSSPEDFSYPDDDSSVVWFAWTVFTSSLCFWSEVKHWLTQLSLQLQIAVCCNV